MMTYLIAASLILVLLFLWGYWSSNLILKKGRLPVLFNPEDFGRKYESFTVTSEDGINIEGWFVPAAVKSRSTIIVLHGLGANKGDVLDSSIALAREHNLAYFDFRNHGNSGGDTTSLSLLEIKDLAAVVKYLKATKKGLSENLGVFGFSMGGAVAISGSANIPEIKAVAVESPFGSYERTIAHFAWIYYRVPKIFVPCTLWFARTRLGLDPNDHSPDKMVSKISPRPLLIIQGGSDLRMPVIEGRTLYDNAGQPKELWIVPEAHHVSARGINPEEYDKKVADFFRKLVK